MFSDFLQSQRIQELAKAIEQGKNLLVEELWNPPKALVAAIAQKVTHKNILFLLSSSREESSLFHDFSFFTEHSVVDFPAWETLPSENIPPSADIVGERYQVLQTLLHSDTPHIVLANLQAALQKLIPPSFFITHSLSLEVGAHYPFDLLVEKLVEMGYVKRQIVSDKGEFAVRGGLIDLFPVSSPDPYRIEFFGDDIESIRLFDPVGQKSINTVQNICLSPGTELELLDKLPQKATLLDYLGKDTLVIVDDIVALEDRYAALLKECARHPAFCNIDEFLEAMTLLQKIFLTEHPVDKISEVIYHNSQGQSFYSQETPFHDLSFSAFNRTWDVSRWNHFFCPFSDYLFPSLEEQPTNEEVLTKLCSVPQNEVVLYVLSASEQEETHFRRQLEQLKLSLPSGAHYLKGYLSCGFVLTDLKLILFPQTELTKRVKLRRQKLRSTTHTSPYDVSDFMPGELVVHLNNGIGRFTGIERKPNHLNVLSEFLTLEFAEQAKLYVPIQQAYLLTKYVGSHEEVPKLSTLGSSKWKKTKETTERSVLNYASDLLKDYAQRAIAKGFVFEEDSDDLLAFENEFPFDETEDQLQAITEIKQDMMSEKAMDRLVCGDVGYGKTEVAMRAAFKAVRDGNKQVAVLVPTTVLAMQHFESFSERMTHFPINVSVLSRFRTQKQCRETIEGLSKGTVDIVIGTHRLISKDVSFHNLGLVIIDEEQRFGVKAKESLKKIKVGVDCLTLSATPIPRTLYMSLIGARDMSTINTPPQDRLPIKTVIAEPSDETLKTALLRELMREGQAFVIHNRVETIYGLATRIKNLLPQAKVIVAHGQMDSDDVDLAFHTFKSGKADILVATTIVENGVDIPNANTILIDQADHFGLASLYQLRGRVGRWNRRAYAYFLVSNLRSLPELSRKRLQALLESGGYGGGMKLAMRDLEIRGAGDILGTQQSGHVSSVGFHLYCKMLKKAIAALQGKSSTSTDAKIELLVDARIPEDYVDEMHLRLEIYHRLGECASIEEVDALWEEIKDRYGVPPVQALWLYHLTRVKVVASLQGYIAIKQDKLSLTFEKQVGKEHSIRKILCSKFKSPQEMEEKLFKELQYKYKNV